MPHSPLTNLTTLTSCVRMASIDIERYTGLVRVESNPVAVSVALQFKTSPSDTIRQQWPLLCPDPSFTCGGAGRVIIHTQPTDLQCKLTIHTHSMTAAFST